jgi:hypothetical protein
VQREQCFLFEALENISSSWQGKFFSINNVPLQHETVPVKCVELCIISRADKVIATKIEVST